MFRNIPACAGKTRFSGSRGNPPEEHPRVRGENIRILWLTGGVVGTSPRARGKLHRANDLPDDERNIPACAGKTGAIFRATSITAEHPRVRGENALTAIKGIGDIGTSPRARGKRSIVFMQINIIRNIPACAGKTAIAISSGFVKPEHPRVRGENSQSLPKPSL